MIFLFLILVNANIVEDAKNVQRSFTYINNVKEVTSVISNHLEPIKQYPLMHPITNRVDRVLNIANKVPKILFIYRASDFVMTYPMETMTVIPVILFTK